MKSSIKKIVIDGSSYDVISMEEFDRLSSLPNPIYQNLCVEINGYVYPVSKTFKPEEVCISSTKYMNTFRMPETEEEKEKYSSKKIIDFNNVKGIRDNILVNEKLRSAEEAKLAIVNTELQLDIPESNSAELRAIKQAINDKHIDADSYKQKFPSNSDFNNDMRALKNGELNNISFFKAKRILNAFDLDMYITLQDKPGAVNPINKVINVKLTGE